VTAAAIAEVRAPTGDGESFFGERGWVVAPRLAVERTFGGRLRLAGEVGYRWREAPGRFLNLYAGDEFTLGVGGSYALPALGFLERWAALAELNAATPARSPAVAAGDALQNAAELLGGLRVGLGGCFEGTVAGGTGIAADAGLGRESWRLLAGLRCVHVSHDRDGDGIDDDADGCPDAAEDRDGFQDADGCPDPDNDADGVEDGDDACPDRAGPREYDGCPDTDGDEIPDVEDACPKLAGPAKFDGCPKEGPPYVKVEEKQLELAASIRFDSGRDTVTADSRPVLDEVAATLQAHPELRKVRIEGHTDSQGSDAFNLELSRRRARAVVDQLVRRGVAAGRLDSEGYGETRPLADNRTALGRAKNRRVELAIVERR
jgi:outer membrane protein OmpA-like peptidoglycan-associated protein